MLPIKLELKNFLAYRHPDVLLLQDLHLACLTGPNGAGKSSLLDAITWVLWGKARTRHDDDMIHLGESEMSVTLDFLQDGDLYRVMRSRKVGKSRDGKRNPGTSLLTLFGWNEELNTFEVISGGVQDTQAHINQLLRLSHDVFVNSAFLQQGKADTFTTQTPGERKKILSEILGLDRWSLYEEEAKEQLNEIEFRITSAAIEIERMKADIEKEPALIEELEDAKSQLDYANAAVQEAQTSLDEVRGADIELSHVQRQLAATESNLTERKNDLSTIEEEITYKDGEITTLRQVMEDADSIREGYARLEEAQAANIELGDKLIAMQNLSNRRNELVRQIDEAQKQIELEISVYRTKVQTDQNTLDAAEQFRASLTDLDGKILQLEACEDEQEQLKNIIISRKEDKAGLIERNKVIHGEAHELRHRMDMIEAVHDPTCPLCGQPLDEKHRKQLLNQMEAEGKKWRNEFDTNRERQNAITDEIHEHEKQLAVTSEMMKDLTHFRIERAKVETQLDEMEAAASRLQSNQIKLEELTIRLNEENYAKAYREQLREVEGELDGLGYDSDEHQLVRESLETYRTYQNRAQQLEFAQQAIPKLEMELARKHENRDRHLQIIENLRKEQLTHQANIEHLQVVVAEMRRREEELQHQRTKQRQAQEGVIAVEQQLNAIKVLRDRLLKELELKEQLASESVIVEQLKNAFGKNGIPAMIIEAVIPELEDATNRLLSRMTSNRMHVRFDTQREKKTGGLIETLDILIADELGTRDYSLFSGGEAFRINFAIRIALSQLLARRAGAKLRTLFIDEGFGTQDDAGRERLVEAITAIQDDFDLILVITHIEELRDAFPARIEVVKTQTGSFAMIR